MESTIVGSSETLDLPYAWRMHQGDFGEGASLCLEIGPNEGAWKPFIFGVASAEKTKVVSAIPGEAGRLPNGALVSNPFEGPAGGGHLWCWQRGNAASGQQRYFVFLRDMPAEVYFGVAEGLPQYHLFVGEVLDEDDGGEDDPD